MINIEIKLLSSYKKINKCRICNSSDLYEYLNLGNQPLANSFIKENVGLLTVPSYPSSFIIALIIVVFPDPISPLKINIFVEGFNDKTILAVLSISSIE